MILIQIENLFVLMFVRENKGVMDFEKKKKRIQVELELF